MKKNVCLFMAVLVVAALVVQSHAAVYSGGDGSAASPYRIHTVDDLVALSTASGDWSRHFILTADLDLAGQTFYQAVIAPDTNVGSRYFQGTAFTGTFDGNHHTIDHLTILGQTYIGLFGKISNGAVADLTITNAEIYGTSAFGVLAGQNYDGTITNSSATGLMDGEDAAYDIGGLVGINDGTMSGCRASCTITGLSLCYRMGGLVGYNDNGTIENCTASGSVTATTKSYSLGGLAGLNESVITACSSDASVSGGNESYYVGGLAGRNSEFITLSSASGTVAGGEKSREIGGLAGYNTGTLENCQADTVTVTGGVSAYRIGGLVGSNIEIVIGCLASGTIQGGTDSDYLGGLVGYSYGKYASIKNCTANCTVTGSEDSYGIGGLVGRNEKPAMVAHSRSEGTISGGVVLGGLVGDNSGTIHHSLSDASVVGPDDSYVVGGLVGLNTGTITTSCALGSVQGGASSSYIGGLVGDNSTGSSVTNCFCSATVSGADSSHRIGGLAGNLSGGAISNCYSTGTVSGGMPSYNIGGLVGYFNGSAATVNNCYAVGSVSGQTGSLYLGGLIGCFVSGTISNCFWDTETTRMADAAGFTAGTITNVFGKTSADMKTQSTYTAYGWDFLNETTNGTSDLWRMCVDGVQYPKLTWQHVEIGDFACPDGVRMDDFARLSRDWMLTYPTELFGADANGDGKADLSDFTIFAAHWLQGI